FVYYHCDHYFNTCPTITSLNPLSYTTLFRSMSCRRRAGVSSAMAASAPQSDQAGVVSMPRAPRGREEPGGNQSAILDCAAGAARSEEHTSELQSPYDLVCRLLIEKKYMYT